MRVPPPLCVACLRSMPGRYMFVALPYAALYHGALENWYAGHKAGGTVSPAWY